MVLKSASSATAGCSCERSPASAFCVGAALGASQQRAQAVQVHMGSSAVNRQQLGTFKTISLSLDASSRVAYLSLSRPDRSNSINAAMWAELPQATNRPRPPPPPPPRQHPFLLRVRHARHQPCDQYMPCNKRAFHRQALDLLSGHDGVRVVSGR